MSILETFIIKYWDGAVYGSLRDYQLRLLAGYLEAGKTHKTAIFMHHPAVIGVDWLDKINLKEGKNDFIELTIDYRVELSLSRVTFTRRVNPYLMRLAF